MSANKHSDDDDQSLHLKAGPSNDVAILEIQQRPGSSHVSTHRHMTHQTSDQSDNSDDDDDDDDDNDDDDDVDVQAAALEGTYDPNEFSHLPVSPEVKDLFQNITRYTPQNIELDYKLRPFIPDFIPAVGDIDAFLKIPRPDGKSDSIGLKVLDEPCAKQSEPAVLHLQLRAVAKQSSAKAVVVKRVECAEKNTKAIDRWMKDISDLHRSKPPPTVHYSNFVDPNSWIDDRCFGRDGIHLNRRGAADMGSLFTRVVTTTWRGGIEDPSAGSGTKGPSADGGARDYWQSARVRVYQWVEGSRDYQRAVRSKTYQRAA
ncbi:intraflagellar transport protein 46 homolog isoform X5 [Periplaneta americana]|uniref:intraflagellar transport protein 46 homolog isoform X5 n=1 Tax=Periplaneta americana TaxID=6978 RepID=UPI0037E79582